MLNHIKKNNCLNTYVGFASYMETIGTEAYLPESGKVERMFIEHRLSSFAPDALLSSNAISADVDNPYYATTSFTIIYDKGSSLLRMIENFMTPPTFYAGVHQYLKNHLYSTATRQDFFDALDAAAEADGIARDLGGNTVADIMETWATQAGYPEVTVTVGEQPNQLTLTQRRFV